MRNADLPTAKPPHGLKRWTWLFWVSLPLTTGLLVLTQTDLANHLDGWQERLFPPPPTAHPYPFRDLLRRDRPSTTPIQTEIAFYQQQIRNHPSSGLHQAALASAYLRMGRATGQATWYLLAQRAAQQSLVKLPFSNADALTVLARVAEARHDFDGALKLAAQIPNPQEAIALQTTAHLALGNLDLANQAATQLVDQTFSQNSYTLLALVQSAQGQDTAALQSFGYALEMEEPGELGTSARTRTLLGRFHYERGRLEQAEALYREALRIVPDSRPALLNLAQLEIRRGNHSAAERLYRQVAAIADGATVYTPLALRGLARVRSLRGDRPAAEQFWREAETQLRQGSDNPNDFSFGHRRDLARLMLERGRAQDIATALDLMQTEVQHRRDADTLETYARTLMATQRWQEARTIVQEAIALGTRDAALFHRAAAIEQALQNPTQAQIHLRQSQAIDPQFNPSAQQAADLGSGLGS